MSKVIFEKDKIIVISKGKRKGKHNFEQIECNSEDFKDRLKQFIRQRTFKNLGELMNTPNVRTGRDFENSIYRIYFFVLHLLWAFEEELVVEEHGKLKPKVKICGLCHNPIYKENDYTDEHGVHKTCDSKLAQLSKLCVEKKRGAGG